MEDAAAAEAAWREVGLTWSWPFGAQDEEPPTADPGSFDPRMLAGTAPLSALSLPADCAGPVVGRLALGLDLAERRAVALRDWLGAWQAGEADRLRRSLVHIRGLRQRALVLAMVVIFTLLIWALVAAGR
jgi:hypothetical protein